MPPEKRGRLFITTIVSGVLSISSYILLFMHQEFVIDYFTRGGFYALLPIMTAFYFSVVHGMFTSNLLHLFGVRAAHKPKSAVAKKERS